MKNNTTLIEVPELIEIDSFEEHTTQAVLNNMKSISFQQQDSKPPVAGYGRCRSCDCKGYISKHNGSHECKNCQHHYDRHND